MDCPEDATNKPEKNSVVEDANPKPANNDTPANNVTPANNAPANTPAAAERRCQCGCAARLETVLKHDWSGSFATMPEVREVCKDLVKSLYMDQCHMQVLLEYMFEDMDFKSDVMATAYLDVYDMLAEHCTNEALSRMPSWGPQL